MPQPEYVLILGDGTVKPYAQLTDAQDALKLVRPYDPQAHLDVRMIERSKTIEHEVTDVSLN